jgi:tetratricopeptide (TPR) repeat protein
VIQLDPNYALAYYYRGLEDGYNGSFDKAINDFTEAIRLDPNYASACDGPKNAYLRTGNRPKANADVATARRLKAQ